MIVHGTNRLQSYYKNLEYARFERKKSKFICFWAFKGLLFAQMYERKFGGRSVLPMKRKERHPPRMAYFRGVPK